MNLDDVVTREEMNVYTQRSDLKATAAVAFNWAFIAAIFYGVALWPNPLTVLVGIALLGGRHLAFAALMHDCGHHTLFTTAKANDIVGQWLCSYPILSDVHRYARGHQRHHVHAGTTEDPDLPNYQSYPITKVSFRRKIVRDLTAQTGWKALRATGRRGRTEIVQAPWNGNSLAGHVLVHGAMFGVLALAGHPLLYFMWPAAFLTSYMLIARLRQVAEHGAVPDLFDLDPRANTRTIYVRWWEKLFVAPFNLNYHLEHHFRANVPCYNLKAFHFFLKGKGIYRETHFPMGYGELLRQVVISDAEPAAATASAN